MTKTRNAQAPVVHAIAKKSGESRRGAADVATPLSRKSSVAKNAVAPIARSNGTKSGAPAKVSQTSVTSARAEKPQKAAAPAKCELAQVKAKRAKLPADFAAQYTRETSKKASPVAIEAPKKRARRSAAERENLRRAMTPDDDFLRRLARAGAINANIADAPPTRRPGAPRRSRKWESRCGKCGTNSTFSTPASLCARCGTIVVRAE